MNATQVTLEQIVDKQHTVVIETADFTVVQTDDGIYVFGHTAGSAVRLDPAKT